MSEPRLTFITDVRRSDYCEGCQKEGGNQVSGVKRHRSLPLDTWLTKITMCLACFLCRLFRVCK